MKPIMKKCKTESWYFHRNARGNNWVKLSCLSDQQTFTADFMANPILVLLPKKGWYFFTSAWKIQSMS